jgi:hypothetical protein
MIGANLSFDKAKVDFSWSSIVEVIVKKAAGRCYIMSGEGAGWLVWKVKGVRKKKKKKLKKRKTQGLQIPSKGKRERVVV